MKTQMYEFLFLLTTWKSQFTSIICCTMWEKLLAVATWMGMVDTLAPRVLTSGRDSNLSTTWVLPFSQAVYSGVCSLPFRALISQPADIGNVEKNH